MARAFILLMDSFGIGNAPDARAFGDEGSDTLGHIAKACAEGKADDRSTGNGALQIPNMQRLGLAHAAQIATGRVPAGLSTAHNVEGLFGSAAETSNGKDTPSGHWEIAGVPVQFDWGYFPHEVPCFPNELIEALVEKANLPGVLGNCHASGTEIIARLGEEHLSSGKPIVYTSADSVLQIAAHEESFGLDHLLELCLIARDLVDSLNIGRVIARPFTGESATDFQRTGNRRDYSVLPPAPTLLDHAKTAEREVIAIGKVADIYAHQGVTQVVKASGHDQLMDETLKAIRSAPDGSLTFTNFVDFDALYGHRRDIPGYAAALEQFDGRLPEVEALLQPDDIVVITADHGCDPSWSGTDHTREQVPVLIFGPGVSQKGSIGQRPTFADIGQSVADYLDLQPLSHGTSVFEKAVQSQ
ncbi:phosphopentomutase [Kiloniella sp. b19]|uniref:phosphopentomutase n=1 Tax=Kiloniella sp. GXU_MW_B19 TaxID=3141326 RepID=UPI0031E3B813